MCIRDSFNRAQEVDGVVLRGDYRASLHVGARYERYRAVRIDMVAAILRVVFNDKDQRIVRVPAVCDLLNQQANRVIVIGLL